MIPSLDASWEDTFFDKDSSEAVTYRHSISQSGSSVTCHYSSESQLTGEKSVSEKNGIIAAVFPDKDCAKIRWDDGSRSLIGISTRRFEGTGSHEVFHIRIPENLIEGRTFLETAFVLIKKISSRCCGRDLACTLAADLVNQFNNASDGAGWSTEDNGVSFNVQFGRGKGLLIILIADDYPFLIYYTARGLFNKNEKGGFRYNNISISSLECSGFFDRDAISEEINLFCSN